MPPNATKILSFNPVTTNIFTVPRNFSESSKNVISTLYDGDSRLFVGVKRFSLGTNSGTSE